MTSSTTTTQGAPARPRWKAIVLGVLVAATLFGLVGLVAALAVIAFRPGSRMRRLFTDPAMGLDPATQWDAYPEFHAGNGAQHHSTLRSAIRAAVDGAALLVALYMGTTLGFALESLLSATPMDMAHLSSHLDGRMMESPLLLVAAMAVLVLTGRYHRSRLPFDPGRGVLAMIATGLILDAVPAPWSGQLYLGESVLTWLSAAMLLQFSAPAGARILGRMGIPEQDIVIVGAPDPNASVTSAAIDVIGWRTDDQTVETLVEVVRRHPPGAIRVLLMPPANTTLADATAFLQRLEARGLPTELCYALGSAGTLLDAGAYVEHGRVHLSGVLERRRGMAEAVKRCVDVVGALTGMVLLTPVALILMVMIASDGGPVIFSHNRIGRRGIPFPCFKLRTMCVDAEARLKVYLEENPEAAAEWAATFKLREDPRITRIGHFLRRSSLDELPQLLNVLRGEMSLVGPRPVVQAEIDEHYGAAAAEYMSVRPGITGLWQISGRSDTTYPERVAMDCHYARHWGVVQDLVIVVLTLAVPFSRRGAY